MRIGRICTETGLPSIGPFQTGWPNHQDKSRFDLARLAAKRDRQGPFDVAFDRDLLGGAGKLDDANLGEAHRLAVHLLGDGAAALIAHVIDGGGDRDDGVALVAGPAAAA